MNPARVKKDQRLNINESSKLDLEEAENSTNLTRNPRGSHVNMNVTSKLDFEALENFKK